MKPSAPSLGAENGAVPRPAVAPLPAAASLLGMKSGTLRMKFRRGQLPEDFLYRAGGTVWVDVEGVTAWVRNHRPGAVSAPHRRLSRP